MKTNVHGRAFVLLACVVCAAMLPGCLPDATTEDAAPEVVTSAPLPESAPSGEGVPLDQVAISLEPVLDGFEQPLYVTGAGDGSGRLFVLEKTGRAWVMAGGERTGVFLDLSEKVSTESEQGLLGMAFSPGFPEDSLVFVSYTELDGSSVLSRFTVTGDAADPASETKLLRVNQPYANHNGGMIAFGPDGYLYYGLGDGGGSGDPYGSGQDGGTLLGKLLRLDVVGGAGDPAGYVVPDDNPFVERADMRSEIWALGLRNPWRFSFDRATGDLWIGDVGQNALEEIDLQAADSPGGENYGWNLLEGTRPYPSESSQPDLAGFAMPIVEYGRDAGTSVTGGYVYRGTAEPELYGTYFYADFSVGRVWGLQAGSEGVETRELLDTDLMIASFGEDDDGELYVVDFNGGVYRIVAE